LGVRPEGCPGEAMMATAMCAVVHVLAMTPTSSIPASGVVRLRGPAIPRFLPVMDEPQDVARFKLQGAGRLGRRTLRMDFTCRACGGRTSRLINPEAYAKGVCMVQCGECKKYHLVADNIDYLESGFKNVVEWGKANGIPDILMKGAEQLPRADTQVSEEEGPDDKVTGMG